MALTLLSADSPSLTPPLGVPQWGIFDQNGAPILAVDSVASIEYARDYRISDYPQEKGAFESYNKVKVPFQAKVGFLISENRFSFLSTVEDAVASLNLVSVITPEISYPSANLTHYGYRREVRNGVTLIRVDVWCEEIRIVAQAAAAGAINQQPAQTHSTNAPDPKPSGQVQPVPTKQNAPAASDTSVGGNFDVPGGVSMPIPPVGQTGPSATFTIPDTVPAGIPNSTGGAASSTVSRVQDTTTGPARF